MYQRYVDVHPTAGNVDVARGKVKELARRLEPAPDAPLSGADALWRGEIGEAIHRLVNENYTDVASQFEMAVVYRVISFSHGLLTTVETTHQEGDVGWSVGSCSAALARPRSQPAPGDRGVRPLPRQPLDRLLGGHRLFLLPAVRPEPRFAVSGNVEPRPQPNERRRSGGSRIRRPRRTDPRAPPSASIGPVTRQAVIAALNRPHPSR